MDIHGHCPNFAEAAAETKDAGDFGQTLSISISSINRWFSSFKSSTCDVQACWFQIKYIPRNKTLPKTEITLYISQQKTK